MAHIDNNPPQLEGIDTWIFDLDNTIYPAASRLFDQVRHRMTDYIQHHFSLDRDDARTMQRDLFLRHRTTMKGLMIEHGTDPHHFMDFVHDIDLSTLGYDAALDEGIDALPGRKVIFTNGSNQHAERILDAYGIRHHFDHIFDIVGADFVPKPEQKAFDSFVSTTGIDPLGAVMVEDMARNLEPAHALGMRTVWLVSDHDWAAKGADEPYVHFVAEDLKSFLSALAIPT